MQARVADFLVKPVPPVELVRTCARVAKPPASAETTEAQIFTFLPAVGGAGVTTLAVQTAMLLLNSGARGKTTTCLVDLDFQHGACADYLDIEPRLNLSEIEPRPERLDRQLLEVMISQHPSGLAVVAAPNRPAEMRLFDPDVVTRLLDLVSSHFDYVVFDMPRTWFSWTDSVLLGSDKLFIVSETTVPGLRQAKQLVDAIRDRLGDGPQPQVIINRFVQKMFSPGLRKSDIQQAIGDAFLACVPNDYGLVREAIDRGVPLEEVKKGNKITLAAQEARSAASRRQGRPRKPPKARKSSSCHGRDRKRRRQVAELRRRKRVMASRFSMRRVAAPELVPAAEESVLDERVVDRAPRGRRRAGRARRRQSAAHRQAPRRQGAAAPPADRGDQSVGAGKAAGRGNPRPRAAARFAICAGRAAGAQHPGAQRLRLGNSRRDDRASVRSSRCSRTTTVNDILINGHECVYVERSGVLEPTGVRFKDEAHLLRIINKIVSAVGRRVDESHPMCDARLLDGSRVNVAVRPVAIDGPLMSIRKFSKKPFNLNKLVEVGALRPQMAELLAAAVKARVTLIISGGTGSGKTTMLNALSAFISEKERLLTIEDAAELQLQQPHVGRMETRPPNIEGKGEIRQRDLVKNALRMRPDRVILGECRGEEAFDMLQAMNTGHEGSMATIHANTPRDAISRLEQMIGMAGLPMTVASRSAARSPPPSA